MPSNPTVTEVARNFAQYINRVVFRRERFVLTRGKKPVAELRPVPAGSRLGELADVLATLPRLAEEDRDAFAADLEQARAELSAAPARDPWQS